MKSAIRNDRHQSFLRGKGLAKTGIGAPDKKYEGIG
jgi:hypothetical protein